VSSISPEFLRKFDYLIVPNIVEYGVRPNIFNHCVLYIWNVEYETVEVYDSAAFQGDGTLYAGVLRNAMLTIDNMCIYMERTDALPCIEFNICEQQAKGSLDCGVYVGVWIYIPSPAVGGIH
jgi:hypothetical protein